MQNEVNIRLGRKRGPTADAQRKVALKKCEQMREEMGVKPMSKTFRQFRDSLIVEELRNERH